MSSVGKQIIRSVLLSLGLFILVTAGYFYLFPLSDWSLLLEVEIMGRLRLVGIMRRSIWRCFVIRR